MINKVQWVCSELIDGVVNVYPRPDMEEHELDVTCWCQPDFHEQENGILLIQHARRGIRLVKGNNVLGAKNDNVDPTQYFLKPVQVAETGD